MIEWNKVTWYSTSISIVFFLIILPIIVFVIGMRYKEVTSTYIESQNILKESIRSLKAERALDQEAKTSTSTEISQ